MSLRILLLAGLLAASCCSGSDILMITMGGTKSHKIPFLELAKGLIPRGHNITFLNGFPADFTLHGLQEVTPSGLVEYIRNYTNWDLLGARMRGDMPLSLWDAFRYSWQVCDATLEDKETMDLLGRKFDLMILDGAFPECALGLVYRLGVPFMYINTVGFYTGTMAWAGNPVPYSTTPVFYRPATDDMNFFERLSNTFHTLIADAVYTLDSCTTCVHLVTLTPCSKWCRRYRPDGAKILLTSLPVSRPSMMYLQRMVRRHLGSDVPNIWSLGRNVSFILQNGQASVTYPRPLLPNVAEIACIHCKPASALPKDLEDFIAGAGESGFIYVSMGSSVKAANMPDHLRKLLVQTFAHLPYRVLWKYEASPALLTDLPTNVRIARWLPQQDILGHRKLRAFVTHGGLLSMFETVYHGVPIVTMPVFCDHDANAAKAVTDGYALKLELETITSEKLIRAIHKVIHDPRYRREAKRRQILLKDQRSTPLETAIYWTEYVIRHNGAYHLQSPARNLNFLQYYCLDQILFFIGVVYLLRTLTRLYLNPRIVQLGKEKLH